MNTDNNEYKGLFLSVFIRVTPWLKSNFPIHPTTAPAFVSAASNCSLLQSALMKSSCRAPALSAMAFQPFCVGTVTRTLTLPLGVADRPDHSRE